MRHLFDLSNWMGRLKSVRNPQFLSTKQFRFGELTSQSHRDIWEFLRTLTRRACSLTLNKREQACAAVTCRWHLYVSASLNINSAEFMVNTVPMVLVM